MTKTQSSFFRFILFLFGAGIVLLAFFLFSRDRELSEKDVVTWISIGVMYLVLFIPFFFTSLSVGTFSGKIPSLGLIWTGIFLYISLSIAILALLRFSILSFNAALVVQAIVLFGFIIVVYLGYFASSHAGNVAAEEAGKLQGLSEMKNRAAFLALRAGALPANYGEVQKLVARCTEDIRYFSPVGRNRSAEVDAKILDAANNLIQLCDTVMDGGQPASLEGEAKKLQTLVRERGLLRD
jgi:hypothetical protein